MTIDNDDLFEKIESEEEDRNIELSKTYQISIHGADYTLSVLKEKLDKGDIFLPSFQRRYIWPVSKASKLIESFLMGLPVPQIFLYKELGTEKLLIVDGHQRLKTIQYYLNEKLPSGRKFKLNYVRSQWKGKAFSDLSGAEKRRIEDSILRASIFQQTDPSDNTSIFEVFERLNTGGVKLNSQEIRNCVIRGKIRDFLKDLNKYKNWRILFSKSKPDKRMRDIEMILRFLALYERLKEYTPPMKEFLTKFMEDKVDLSEEEEEKYSTLFKNTIDIILDKIGKDAFKRKNRINVAIFDAVTVSIAKLIPDKIAEDRIFGNYHLLIKDLNFKEFISLNTTYKETVQTRIKMAMGKFNK